MDNTLKEKIIKYIKEFIAQDRGSEVLYQFYDLEIDITDEKIKQFNKLDDKLGNIEFMSELVLMDAVNTLIMQIKGKDNLYLQDCMYKVHRSCFPIDSYKDVIGDFKLRLEKNNSALKSLEHYRRNKLYLYEICGFEHFVTLIKFKKPAMLDDEMFKDNIVKKQKLKITIDRSNYDTFISSINITPIE